MIDIPDDWFNTTARENFERAFLPASNQPKLNYLQIGAFTGNASTWLLENVLTHPTSQLWDVDPWDGGLAEAMEYDWSEVEALYDERVQGRTRKFKCSSWTFFTQRCHPNQLFDFIYIDGDHTVISTLEDAVMSYRHLKPGGVIAFDDYTWKSKHGVLGEPGMAIDMLKYLYADRLWVLRVDSQCWMKRVDAQVRP